jgi:hypothetical protein
MRLYEQDRIISRFNSGRTVPSWVSDSVPFPFSSAKFCCQKCGYEGNADYNAAKNIGFRLLRAGQKSPHGGATRHLALKSGTLNVNGGYSPATQ